MAAMVVLAIATRDIIPLAFLGTETPRQRRHRNRSRPRCSSVGASFFIADGMQTVAAGALRGFNDTRIPLADSPRICFWVVGISGLLSARLFPAAAPIGVWIGLSIGVALYAVLLVWRFHAPDQARLSADLPGRLT